MRILFVTQWFDPEPTPKGLTFARELARRGHQVQVLTGFPNYPGGRLYSGYRLRLLQRERIDGVDLIRVPLYPSHSKSRVGRIANYMSFAAAAALIGTIVVTRPDVIYAYHPPPTTAVPALLIRALYRARLIYDIQDLWPDSAAATGMLESGLALRLVSAWCRFIYMHADHLSVLSPGFKRALIERGVPEEKISVIYNWCDEPRMARSRGMSNLGALNQWTDKFLVVFAGTMGVAQSLDSVLRAAQLIQSTRPHVQFVFLGGGTEVDRLKRKVIDDELSNVCFLPRVDVDDIASVLARADALLVHLKGDPLFEMTIPSKTQAYMAAGRPILMAVAGDAARLVRQANCGVTCSPDDPRAIADAVVVLLEKTDEDRRVLGENGRRFYQSSLSLGAGVGEFEAVFRAPQSAASAVASSSAISSHG